MIEIKKNCHGEINPETYYDHYENLTTLEGDLYSVGYYYKDRVGSCWAVSNDKSKLNEWINVNCK